MSPVGKYTGGKVWRWKYLSKFGLNFSKNFDLCQNDLNGCVSTGITPSIKSALDFFNFFIDLSKFSGVTNGFVGCNIVIMSGTYDSDFSKKSIVCLITSSSAALLWAYFFGLLMGILYRNYTIDIKE